MGGNERNFAVEFHTEHREIVEVSASCESDAREFAEAERDYDGELVQTVHTEVRSLHTDTEQ